LPETQPRGDRTRQCRPRPRLFLAESIADRIDLGQIIEDSKHPSTTKNNRDVHELGEGTLKYIVRWEIGPSVRKAAIERFLKTGGAPPAGVTMVSRWHSADGAFGFAIADSDDVQAMSKWAMAWNDLLPMDVRPALDDQGIGAVLTSMA